MFKFGGLIVRKGNDLTSHDADVSGSNRGQVVNSVASSWYAPPEWGEPGVAWSGTVVQQTSGAGAGRFSEHIHIQAGTDEHHSGSLQHRVELYRR